MLIKAGAKEYRIEYNLNSICDFEEITNMDVAEMTARRLSGLRIIRALLFCGLKKNHPDLTIEDAGNILNDYIKNGKTISTLYNVINSEMEKAGFKSNENTNNREKKRNSYHSRNNVSKHTNT